MTLRSLTKDRDDRQRSCVHQFPITAPHSEAAPGPCVRCDLPWGDLTFRQKYLFSAGVYGRDPEVSVVTDLRAAAALSRAAAGVMKSGVGDAMAELLELAAKDLEICDAQNSRAPDNDGKTRIMPQVWTKHAVELARALLVVKE